MNMLEHLFIVLTGLVFIGVMYGLLLANVWISNFFASRKGLHVSHAIEEDCNLAVAIQRGSLIIGIGLGMYGVISGPSSGFETDLIAIASYGALVSVFFVFARGFSDWFVLHNVDNLAQVRSGNISVALAEGGALIGTGIIAMSSMMGSGGDYWTAIAFFLAGQLLMLLAVSLYEWLTAWNVRDEIASNNASAGLLIGGMLVALSIALHGVVSTDFVSWEYNLPFLLVEGVIAVTLMIVIKSTVDRVFLPGTSIEHEVVDDKNVAAVVLVSAFQIVGALAISAAVL